MRAAARALVSRAAVALLLVGRVAYAAPERVAVVIDATDAPPLGARAHAALMRQAGRDDRVAAQPLDVGLGAEQGTLDGADAALAAAQRQLEELDLDAAQGSALKARDLYEANLVELAARDTHTLPLRDAVIALAKIKFLNGDADGAKESLRRALALDPKLTYSAKLFPQSMRRTVVEARLLYDTLGETTIEVTSDPSGADVFLDGTPASKTPTKLAAAPGPHAVEVRAKDRVTMVKRVDVDDKGAQLVFALAKPTGPAADARAITVALSSASSRDCEALAKTLDADALILVRLGGQSSFTATGAVYLRGTARGTLTAPIEKSGAQSEMEGQLEALGRALLDERADRRAAMTLAEASSHERHESSFRRSKAFWYVVGGVAAVVVVGVGVGVGLGVGLGEARQRQLADSVVLLGGR